MLSSQCFIERRFVLRFLAGGPSIPDDLLLARDQGRVIFFCGAGVSRARANLPDFFGLARMVVSNLGVDQDSPAYKLILEAQEIDRRVGISGVISADRVFGLLERDFSKHDIEEAVASALKPQEACDCSAHKILLDLATTPMGEVQLVTTNFDRLFEECGRSLKVWESPKLPNLTRPSEFNGIVYLHGRSTPTYSGAEKDGFILSSSEFGRAYLSDGWATEFIREILNKYVVVFVGYTADDPPVQYLLEALRKTTGRLENAYAFQSGDYNDAVARWRHKGVTAISYSSDNGHQALWQSLEIWADRARDPDAWISKVINTSKKGPSALEPHERGQVAHIVSTYEGVKKFHQGEVLPPADWLCVFDKYRRFAKSVRLDSLGAEGHCVDPFDVYGLDSDTPPTKIAPEDHYAKREPPLDAWDAFELNRLDRSLIRNDNLSEFRGYWANNFPRLIPRIAELGVWLAKVCDQPAAVWWAAHQTALNQSVQEGISWELQHSSRLIDQNIRNAWQLLFEAKNHNSIPHTDWYSLQASIKKDGWNSTVVRKFGEFFRPYFSVEPAFGVGGTAPDKEIHNVNINRLLRISVKYPDNHETITIPDQWCASVVNVLRRKLEDAVRLEFEISGCVTSYIGPIVASQSEGPEYSREYGLSGVVTQFTHFFSQLVKINKSAAKREFLSWPTNDDAVFTRLRIWVSGNRGVISDNDFGKIIESLSNVVFWDSNHQRDLLLVISKRWVKLNLSSRKIIEKKLLRGPERWPKEKCSEFKSRQTFAILERVEWLQKQGCNLSSVTRRQVKLLHLTITDWKDRYGANAADSMVSRIGFVKTNTSHEKLMNIPVSMILSQAKENSGRSDDFFIENDPFTGLANDHPLRALSALNYASKRGDFPEWAWQSFLRSDARKTDSIRLVCLIARRLNSYPDECLSTVLPPISNWIRVVSGDLNTGALPVFDHLLQKIIYGLRVLPNKGRSTILRGSQAPNWTMEAINSPSGNLARALLNDPRKDNLVRNQRFPFEWLVHAEALLRLSNDSRRYVLVIFFHNLNWFYAIDPKWTEEHLLPVLQEHDTDDYRAAWSGFLWGGHTPNRELYISIKKGLLVFAASSMSLDYSYKGILAGIILAGWGTVDDITGERCISDNEMRSLLLATDDEFRSQVIRQVKQWAKKEVVDSDAKWAKQLPELLAIWPRQLSAKSPTISARLCELAFASGDQFPQIAALILPHLITIEQDKLIVPELFRSEENIISQYPEQVLALLYRVLPDTASNWPYGVEGVLRRIGTVDSTLITDNRLILLKRRWDSR